MTVEYEQGDDGWVIASIPEIRGAHSQGRTRAEALENVIDAARELLFLRTDELRGELDSVVGASRQRRHRVE